MPFFCVLVAGSSRWYSNLPAGHDFVRLLAKSLFSISQTYTMSNKLFLADIYLSIYLSAWWIIQVPSQAAISPDYFKRGMLQVYCLMHGWFSIQMMLTWPWQIHLMVYQLRKRCVEQTLCHFWPPIYSWSIYLSIYLFLIFFFYLSELNIYLLISLSPISICQNSYLSLFNIYSSIIFPYLSINLSIYRFFFHPSYIKHRYIDECNITHE